MAASEPRCIGLDWGTTRLRAYLLGETGQVLARHTSDAGVSSARGDFERILTRELGSWLDAYPRLNLIASGMAGSRQGWVETHYVSCPVELASIPSELVLRPLGARRVAFTPGVTRVARDGMPDVMRGEEIQVLGSLESAGEGWFALPGTHSKWVFVEAGRILWFATFMTGELFDVLTQHTLLTRGAESAERSEQSDRAAFMRGVDYALGSEPESGGFLKRLFSTRSLVARGELSRQEAREYLSGLIIGGEVREGLGSVPTPRPRTIHLVGSDALVRRYAAAFERAGVNAPVGNEDAAASGHFVLARQAGLLEPS